MSENSKLIKIIQSDLPTEEKSIAIAVVQVADAGIQSGYDSLKPILKRTKYARYSRRDSGYFVPYGGVVKGR